MSLRPFLVIGDIMEGYPYGYMKIRKDASKNIFQIWWENGKRLPFEVHRRTWPDERYIVVTKIELTKRPYGRAWGYECWNGKEYKSDIIGCAGCYQWVLRKK